jgi:hypothetical protein
MWILFKNQIKPRTQGVQISLQPRTRLVWPTLLVGVFCQAIVVRNSHVDITSAKLHRVAPDIVPEGNQCALKKILPRKNLYLYLAPRTFTNLFLREYMPARDGRGTRKSLFVSASNSLGQGAMGGGVGGGTPSRAALQMSDETFRNYFAYLNRSAMLKRLDT